MHLDVISTRDRSVAIAPVPERDADRFVVVAGIDLSSASLHALSFACGLARGTERPNVHAVHAIGPPMVPGTIDVAWHVDLEDEQRRLEDLCATYANAHGLSVTAHVAFDRPDRAIVTLAEMLRADLIVLASPHAKGGIARLLGGWTTERIARAARCSVLLARDPEDALDT
jgi:nucleotide-binding universal stress UspA family protein